jgi:hypothetical protein
MERRTPPDTPPSQAGFLLFHLTNSRTGERIEGVEVEVSSAEKPDQTLFSIGCASDRPILIPADPPRKALGLQGMEQKRGSGKPPRISSGADVTLEPAE